jgi:glycosyltransferase involved in cell wall biosynthesis
MTPSLSIVILTYNEEANLPFALASVKTLDARVYVVDSGSSDNTSAIARAGGCEVVVHPFTTQAEQINWALESIAFDTDWIMRLDADEVVTPQLASELQEVLPRAASDTTGFEVKRRVVFWNQWIRHGGYYPTWLLRVWKRGTARSEQRWMDEHMISTKGRIGRLRNDIIDENHKGVGFWVDKHNHYADREVNDLVSAQGSSSQLAISGQAGRRRWLKQRVYTRLPLFFRAFAYWFFRYVLRLGFLDGIPGLVFHFNQALWYRLLVDAKLYEMRSGRSPKSPLEPTR